MRIMIIDRHGWSLFNSLWSFWLGVLLVLVVYWVK